MFEAVDLGYYGPALGWAALTRKNVRLDKLKLK